MYGELSHHCHHKRRRSNQNRTNGENNQRHFPTFVESQRKTGNKLVEKTYKQVLNDVEQSCNYYFSRHSLEQDIEFHCPLFQIMIHELQLNRNSIWNRSEKKKTRKRLLRGSTGVWEDCNNNNNNKNNNRQTSFAPSLSNHPTS
jgi:hypothetical protein